MTDMATESHWRSVEDLLSFAIDREQEAVDFYKDLAQRADNPAMSEVFMEFSQQEEGHKARLQKVKSSGHMESSSRKILDLKIGDYLVDVTPGPDMDYQQALIIAIKREQAACSLYRDLAAAVEEGDVRDLMLALADEEARHKLHFETEYDDYVLADN